jgi:hypothetical protein
MPFCDRCDELAANTASLFTELAPDKWWKWFSYPRFPEQEEAFMGCEKHPVEAEIQFLDGTVESFTGRLPVKRWQAMLKADVLIPAVVLALLFALVADRFFHLFSR